MKNKSTYFHLFFLISLSLNGLSQDYLNSYLTEAASNNPGLKSKFSEYQASLEKIPWLCTHYAGVIRKNEK